MSELEFMAGTCFLHGVLGLPKQRVEAVTEARQPEKRRPIPLGQGTRQSIH